ncbi:MAG: MFS transporter [Polyangiaceae bacterium]
MPVWNAASILSRIRDKNIWVVDATIFILGVGYGVSLVLVPIHLTERGFAKTDMGTLAAIFAAGIACFSMPIGTLIEKLSPKVVLVGSLLGYAATAASFPWLPSFASFVPVRFLDGACSVGVWVSCETILLARADKESKAFVMTLYGIAMALGYATGPVAASLIVRLTQVPWVPFAFAAGMATLAALVATVLLDPVEPSIEHSQKAAKESDGTAGTSSLRETLGLLWRVKTPCFAGLAYGYFQATLVLLFPLYLMETKGVSKEDTVLIPAWFAAGVLLFSNGLGRLGDRLGHLRVMRVLAVVGLAMIASFVFLSNFTLMRLAVFVAGATLASISPVSLGLQGVIASPREYGRANSLYNVFYAAGMLLGPPISSRIYGLANGGAIMLEHLAAIWGVFVLASVVFANDDPAARKRQDSVPPAVETEGA